MDDLAWRSGLYAVGMNLSEIGIRNQLTASGTAVLETIAWHQTEFRQSL